MYSCTKFELDKSKFTHVRHFRANFQKIQTLEKFERFNRFWPNSIPKVLDRYIIFVCIFRAIAQILRKLELYHRLFSKNSKSHKIFKWASICMKIVTIERAWLLHWCTKFQLYIPQAIYELSGFEKLKIGHACAHRHTHTNIRTPVKNHISSCFRLFWVFSHHLYLDFFIAFSVRKRNG